MRREVVLFLVVGLLEDRGEVLVDLLEVLLEVLPLLADFDVLIVEVGPEFFHADPADDLVHRDRLLGEFFDPVEDDFLVELVLLVLFPLADRLFELDLAEVELHKVVAQEIPLLELFFSPVIVFEDEVSVLVAFVF